MEKNREGFIPADEKDRQNSKQDQEQKENNTSAPAREAGYPRVSSGKGDENTGGTSSIPLGEEDTIGNP
jgi:hypothetical protein